MKHSKLLMGLTLVMAITLNSFGFDAKQGDMWVGGDFSFTSIGFKSKDQYNYGYDDDDTRLNYLFLTPTIRFFAANHLCIGPKFEWAGVFVDGSSGNIFTIGGELGFVGASNTVYPYLLSSPGAQIYDGESIFELPFSAGIMTKVSEHLGLQLEVGISFKFGERSTQNTLSIGVGVCGFGENNAISVLSKFLPFLL